MYKSVVAQVTVRTLHEIFEADRDALIETMVFNGHVDTINAATGRPQNPCLITLMTTREEFLGRDFTHVDALACLLDLSASVSKSPAELVPVRPVHIPNEPGWATYTLTDYGLVQLDLVRADGRREQFIGPPVEPPDGYRRMRRAATIPTLVFFSCVGIGLALGFGLTDSRCVEASIMAALGGCNVAWFGLSLASAVGRSRAQRAQDAAPEREPEH